MSTYTLTSASSDPSYMVWSTPFPSGTAMLKCVVNEDEDMSAKNDVGDIWLETFIRSPVSGSCSTAGTQTATRSDASYDLKHMVAYEDSANNLEGNCAHVKLHVEHVAAASIDVHVFCYYAGVIDDQPN